LQDSVRTVKIARTGHGIFTHSYLLANLVVLMVKIARNQMSYWSWYIY